MSDGFACIGLFNPKSPENVGVILRAAGCYDVNSVFYTGKRYARARDFVTDTKKVHQKIPYGVGRRNHLGVIIVRSPAILLNIAKH